MRTEVYMIQDDIEEIIAKRFGVEAERVLLKCTATAPNEISITCVVTLDNPKQPNNVLLRPR